MTETHTDQGALATWSADECPFVIEFSRKALDDIRLAVVDAFFSLPRGGAEIGGILLGKVDDQRVQILDYAPIECEHAFGPAFTLSPADQVQLGDALRQPFPGGLRPVGWYHSHTRSEIALSEADLDIHNRYFPERWQVALVLRPSTLQPTQAGFFFREPDGTIQAQHSYHEFAVEALPLQQVPASAPQSSPGPMRETEPDAVVMTVSGADPHLVSLPADDAPTTEPQCVEPPAATVKSTSEPAPPLLSAPEPVMELTHEAEPPQGREPEMLDEPQASGHQSWPVEAPITAPEPHDTGVEPAYASESEPGNAHDETDYTRHFAITHEDDPKPQRRWMGMAAGLLAGILLGVGADQARSHAGPAVQSVPPPAVTQPQTAPESAALRKQNDGLTKQVSDLTRQVADLTQQNGTLRKENADLTRQQADSSKQQSELSKEQADAGRRQAEIRQQRDDLLKQSAKLKADLTAQTVRAQSLQQQLDELRRQQQRKRLSIQSSDPLP
ncbi:MAG TPA: Mov34/MPN/PAD-1 family protein [Bryobacteraceae bacterium]|nr:Mov34/MPN/PAD-1 family protein [Bryobacteraceae bacterium]